MGISERNVLQIIIPTLWLVCCNILKEKKLLKVQTNFLIVSQPLKTLAFSYNTYFFVSTTKLQFSENFSTKRKPENLGKSSRQTLTNWRFSSIQKQSEKKQTEKCDSETSTNDSWSYTTMNNKNKTLPGDMGLKDKLLLNLKTDFGSFSNISKRSKVCFYP